MKDKFKTNLERNTQMCDLVKSVANWNGSKKQGLAAPEKKKGCGMSR